MNLSKYDNADYDPGAGRLKRFVWYVLNATILNSWLVPSFGFKKKLLQWFGARIGGGFVIKPRVSIKYPWHLSVGDNVWLGEGVWIDNLTTVSIGSNVCISQGAYLLTGNHNYKDYNFRLITKSIEIGNGAWIGAKAIVCPGVSVAKCSVLQAGCVATKSTIDNGIYRGVPAIWVKERVMEPCKTLDVFPLAH